MPAAKKSRAKSDSTKTEKDYAVAKKYAAINRVFEKGTTGATSKSIGKTAANQEYEAAKLAPKIRRDSVARGLKKKGK
jgi:hypothetical protein